MAKVIAEINALIESQRDQFETRDNNRFAMSASQLIRYREFLLVILTRYDSCSREFRSVMEAHKSAFASGSGPMSGQQLALVQESSRVSNLIQLEIESYYLFAKVLLDKVARFLEFYFGAARGMSLDSHDQLTKCFGEYAKIKGIQNGAKIANCLATLKGDIADFRDYQIAHEKSPRAVRGLMYSADGVSMFNSKIYPKESEEQAQSRTLEALDADMQAYLYEFVALLHLNLGQTALARKSA